MDDLEEEEEEDATAPYLPFKVVVSHVCQQWRAVAIGIPTLWNYLDFLEGPPFEKSRIWLERSKECPLDIELDCTDSDMGGGTEDQADLPSESDPIRPQDHVAMPGGLPLATRGGKENKLSSYISPTDLPVVRDLILPHSARWRVFELRVNDFQIMYGILSTLASIPEAPELRELGLYHHDDNNDLDVFSPVHLKQPFAPFCGRAPKLEQVALWGVHVDWESCAFLQGLEDLELAYHAKDVRPPYSIFVRMLRRSPGLHSLNLSGSGPTGNPEDWPTNVIRLPSVKELSLEFIDPSYASALLKRLVFPNLQSLTLDFDSEDYSFFVEQLARPAPNQPHSLCQNIVDLKLSGMGCSDAALEGFYTALPNLISLHLNCYHLPLKFFSLLSSVFQETNDLRYYLPKLTTLKTAGIGGQEMRLLLHERGDKIKHVRMDESAVIDAHDEAYIRARTESFEYFDTSDDEDADTDVWSADLPTDSEGDEEGAEWFSGSDDDDAGDDDDTDSDGDGDADDGDGDGDDDSDDDWIE